LQQGTKFSKVVPHYGEVLVGISDTDSANIDAPHYLVAADQKIIKREITMRYDRVNCERQKTLNRFPDQFGCPAFPLVIEIVNVNKACVDTFPGEGQPVCVIASERALAHWYGMKTAQVCR
jgi:hypothetical protein